jgi:hypothetical protein
MGVTIPQSCAREDGRGGVNMRLPRVPSTPSTMHLHVTGTSWPEWRYSSTWGGNTHAMGSNLRKAGGCWARISHVLRAENATPWMSGMFYKVTVQAVLLYGSETWSSPPSSVTRLEGFHIQAAWRMSGLQPEKKPDGSWSYP